MLICFGLGLCIAAKADVQKPWRGDWELSKFLWFRPSCKTRALRIILEDELKETLGYSLVRFWDFVCHSPPDIIVTVCFVLCGFFLFKKARSYHIQSAFKTCTKALGSNWAVSLSSADMSAKKLSPRVKKAPLKRLATMLDLANFLTQIRTFRQSRGVSGQFAKHSSRSPAVPAVRKDGKSRGASDFH